MSQAKEIIAGPLTLWLAPVGTAFPLIDAEPAADWTLVGTSGDKNYSEDGVSVQHSQTINKVRPAGSTGPRKALRDTEDLLVTVTILDASPEQYALALAGEPEVTAAGVGTAGFKKIGLSRGEEVEEFAMLARGKSAVEIGMNAQYEVPRCYQSGSPTSQFRRGQPVGLQLQYDALEDDDAVADTERFGRMIHQHQAALPEG